MRALLTGLIVLFALSATTTVAAEKRYSFCIEPISGDLGEAGPAWVPVFADHMHSIRCASSNKELNSIALKIRDTTTVLPIEMINQLFDLIDDRRKEIDIGNDPILADNFQRLQKIVEARFNGQAAGSSDNANAVLLGLDAVSEATHQLEEWMVANRGFNRWDRIVASDEIIQRTLTEPKYNNLKALK